MREKSAISWKEARDEARLRESQCPSEPRPEDEDENHNHASTPASVPANDMHANEEIEVCTNIY